MSDSSRKPDRPVSVRKSGTGAADGGGATGETPNSSNRPRTVIAGAVAVLLSGVFAILASLSLYGQHDFLVHQFNKQVLTSAQILTASKDAAVAFDATKSNNNASKVSDALTKSLTDAKNDNTRAVADADVTDQGKKATKLTKSAGDSSSVSTQIETNLQKLQTKQRSDAKSAADRTPNQQLIGGVVLLAICALLAFSVWRGRYWSRWAVIAIWALSSFTGTTVAGINSLLSVTADLPGLFKTAIFLSALAMLAAVVLVLLPPSSRFFALTRPAPRPGAPQRRGLFAPRVPPQSRSTAASTSAPRGTADPDRARSKRRAADAQAVAKGADLARSRAKASKSRRTAE